MYKGTNEITNEDLGFKLMNSMSFGKFVISTGFYLENCQDRPTCQSQLCNSTSKPTWEGSRSLERTPH
jgi:hypothetical protein